MAEVAEASVVVVSTAEAAFMAEAVRAPVLAEALISAAVALVRRTQALEDQASAEVESASACLALQAESRTSRLGPRMGSRLDRLGQLCGRVPAEVRRVAQRTSPVAIDQETIRVAPQRDLTVQTIVA